MVNLELLDKAGINYEGLKKKLEHSERLRVADGPIENEAKTVDDKILKLKELIRQRIQAGREDNISKHKTFHALDLAWETPHRQISTTLLSNLIDKSAEDGSVVQRTLTAWGFNLADVIQEVPDAKTGKPIKRVSIPAFYQIFVPLVRSYVTIRLAKIMNDRRRQPFFKFEPAISTPLTRMQAEVITSRVEMMNQHYDYWSVVKQAVFQMLHYGSCFAFPMEEWHEECQQTVESDPYKRKAKDDKGEVIEGKYERVQKEGLRYHMPHPSRTFCDIAHRASTFNTDTGCEFAGYWKVCRYRDLKQHPKFYNVDKISIGATEWWASPTTMTFFNTVYSSCTITPPTITTTETQDRESKMAENYYTSAMDDKSVVYTEFFMKLIPSEFALGDYDYPVWFRFCVASDDTILYAAPLPYCPIVYYGYDSDELRALNSSLSLEVLPFQDHFSNLMTQYLLSVKQNLTNVTLVDDEIVGASMFKQIIAQGFKLFSERNFFRVSLRKWKTQQVDQSRAFESFRFPPLDVNGIVQAMKVILDTLERVLVMSSQEVAQAATHEQTREEIRNISGATSTRLTYTAIPVDIARDAHKRQLYYGHMAYGEPEFYAQIPLEKTMSSDQAKTMLETLGFTYDANDPEMLRSRRLTVRVKKTAIMLESFASSRDGEDRINNVEAGLGMMQTLIGMINSPLYQVIGPEQILNLINLSAQLMGYPRDFKLQNMSTGGGGDMQQQLAQMAEGLRQSIMEEIGQGLTPMLQAQQKAAQTLEKLEQEMSSDQERQKLENKVRDERSKMTFDNLNERIKQIIDFQKQAPRLGPPQTPVNAPNATILVGTNGNSTS